MSNSLPKLVETGLASHFECPVCFGHVIPPILQCPQGHLICSSCRSKLSSNSCPSCRCSLDGVAIRNLVLEKIAEDILFPCKYAGNGCSVGIKWTEKLYHEKECQFRVAECPIPGCKYGFEGTFSEIIAHIKAEHHLTDQSESTVEFGESNLLRQLEGGLYASLMSCHDQHFLVIIRKVDVGMLFEEYEYHGVVLLIGPREKASDFTYRMETKRGKRKCSWESSPLTIMQNVTESFETGDCFYLNAKTAVVLGYCEYDDAISVLVSVVETEDSVSQMDEFTHLFD